MTLLNEYRETEALVKELKDKLQKLAEDDRLKVEIEFSDKLRALMAEYGKSLRDVIQILDPQKIKTDAVQMGERRPRKVKVYKNAETGEVIETKGGNHKVLKAWKGQYGADVVEGWLQS
ncbi:hypothetical protein FQZ97_1103310 [compost metagenome]